MKQVENFANEKIRRNEMNYNEAELFYSGFSLLDEALTQNKAEDFA